MIKNLILPLLALTMVSACAHTDLEPGAPTVTPVRVPELPAEFKVKAEQLPELTDRTLGGQVNAGIESDRAYNSLGFKYNALIDLYHCVQISMNEKKDPELCLED